MKLLQLLKEVLLVPRMKFLNEATNGPYFLLTDKKTFGALLEDFLDRTPIMQKLLSKNRGVGRKTLEMALWNLTYADEGVGIEQIWKRLEKDNPPDGVRASKDEIDLAKKEMVSFSNEFKKDLPGIENVWQAVYTGVKTGNEEAFENLSAKDIRTYLKYYTSDIVNKHTNIRNSEDYTWFIKTLNDQIKGK